MTKYRDKFYIGDNDWKYKLTKLELHSDKDEYYLEAEYETENKHEKGILHISKIPLRIASIPKVEVLDPHDQELIYPILGRTCVVNLGFGDILLYKDNNPWFTYKVTEEKVEEMTLEEIEKQLGHKVKIVSNKEVSDDE